LGIIENQRKSNSINFNEANFRQDNSKNCQRIY
jgi:hypothetical protein